MPTALTDAVDAPERAENEDPTWLRCSPSSPGCPQATRAVRSCVPS